MEWETHVLVLAYKMMLFPEALYCICSTYYSNSIQFTRMI